jgi:hypothetical protein
MQGKVCRLRGVSLVEPCYFAEVIGTTKAPPYPLLTPGGVRVHQQQQPQQQQASRISAAALRSSRSSERLLAPSVCSHRACSYSPEPAHYAAG